MNSTIKNEQGLTEKEFLENYNLSIYEQPSVTVDMLLFSIGDIEQDNKRRVPNKTLNVLLIQRKNHPFINQWALPGGFVDMDESLEEAAFRELKEETGVNNAYVQQLHTFGSVNRDPRGRVISTAYLGLINHNDVTVTAGDDAKDARWFNLEWTQQVLASENNQPVQIQTTLNLNSGDCQLTCSITSTRKVNNSLNTWQHTIVNSDGLAFDHGIVIHYGLKYIHDYAEDSDMLLYLMPPLFTLSELQKTYELLLRKTLIKANFRRRIAKYVIETEHMESNKGHRPSALYKHRK